MSLQRFACIPLFLIGAATAGVDWTAVWFEPRTPIVLAPGEKKPHVAMGRQPGNPSVELTRSPGLNVTSSNPSVLEIDRQNNVVLVARAPGHTHVKLAFSEATEMIPVFVRQPKNDGFDGVWRAVFTGDQGARPKMVSEIDFELNADGGVLTGTVHAAYWPGDAPVSDGKIDGDRVSFTMVGTSPFQAGSGGVMRTGYPKLCFTGIRRDNEMKIDLRWSEASLTCEDGKLLPMAAKKVTD